MRAVEWSERYQRQVAERDRTNRVLSELAGEMREQLQTLTVRRSRSRTPEQTDAHAHAHAEGAERGDGDGDGWRAQCSRLAQRAARLEAAAAPPTACNLRFVAHSPNAVLLSWELTPNRPAVAGKSFSEH